MNVPDGWRRAPYALVHGEDGEGRLGAVEAWKTLHVDPEWADFSLLVCAEGCPWPEVQNALHESAPFGSNRVVIVPQADNLLERPKELPEPVKRFLTQPLEGTRLLLVCRGTLSAAPGKILASKPFSDWNKEGRILKVGALDPKEATPFIEEEAARMGLRLAAGLSTRLTARMGGHPGILKRTLEVLELLGAGATITVDMVDQATFRLGEQNAFAWSQAWQKGQTGPALLALRQALEEDPAGAPLMLLSQARREVDRLLKFYEAKKTGSTSPDALTKRLGLSPKQAFLLDGYRQVVDRLGQNGIGQLLQLIQQTDLDLKGMALGAQTPLLSLTMSLSRAWSGGR